MSRHEYLLDERHEGRRVSRYETFVPSKRVVKNVPMTLTFEISTLHEFPSSSDLAQQLEDALPREWFEATSGDDWWVRNIDVD